MKTLFNDIYRLLKPGGMVSRNPILPIQQHTFSLYFPILRSCVNLHGHFFFFLFFYLCVSVVVVCFFVVLNRRASSEYRNGFQQHPRITSIRSYCICLSVRMCTCYAFGICYFHCCCALSAGYFILEPQPWSSYLKKKRLTPEIKKTVQGITFRPERFPEYLNTIGFHLLHTFGKAPVLSSVSAVSESRREGLSTTKGEDVDKAKITNTDWDQDTCERETQADIQEGCKRKKKKKKPKEKKKKHKKKGKQDYRLSDGKRDRPEGLADNRDQDDQAGVQMSAERNKSPAPPRENGQQMEAQKRKKRIKGEGFEGRPLLIFEKRGSRY